MDANELWMNGREDKFRYTEVVDGNDIATIDGITGGSITYNYLSDLKCSASLDYSGELTEGWIDKVIRVYLDTKSKSYPELSASVLLGTFMTTTPSRNVSGRSATFTITCYSMLNKLQNKKAAGTYSVESGVNAIQEATKLCEAVGLTVRSVESDYTLKTPYTSDKNDTYLAIVNDLLSMAGYESVGVDEYGNAVLQPYVSPEDKAPSWTFSDNEDGVHMPDIEVEYDVFDTPNEVIVTGSDSENTLTVTVVNDDPNDPLSTVSRGFTVTEVVELDYYDTEENLKTYGKRKLDEYKLSVENYKFEHWYVPIHSGDTVLFQSKSIQNGSSHRVTIHTMDVELSPGALVNDKVRRYREASNG